MSRLNRVVVAAVVAIGVMLAGGAVDAKPQPAPGRVCTKVGRVISVPVPLVCKQTPNNGLRWSKVLITTMASTTTSIAVVVPSVSLSPTLITGGTFPKAVVVTSNVAGTVYFAEGAFSIKRLSDITSADVNKWASGVVYAGVATSVPIDVTAVLNGYYRVYVANADGVLSEPATNIVTISVTRASTVAVTTTTVALTCATGGTCDKGEIGPGGGVVFYVQASGGTFSCGPTLAATCKYLEAAPTTGTNAWTDATYQWSGNTTGLIGLNAQGQAVGTGYKNTEAIVTQSSTANRAATIARAYRGPNNLSDWYLPSKEELSVMKIEKGRVGISTGNYWSSTEFFGTTTDAWYQDFGGSSPAGLKNSTFYVRPVRAFG